MKIKLLILLFVSVGVQAECRRVEVCDDYGYRCHIEQVCDSQFDLPSIGIDPLPSVKQLELKPLPSIGLPPLGTTRCEYKLVSGEWRNVCR